MRRAHLALIVAAAAGALPSILNAQNSNWTYNPGGAWTASWQDTTNWNPNSFPNSTTSFAIFPAASVASGPGTVQLSGAGVTVRQISFSGTGSDGFTIAGAGKLQIMSTGTINVGSSGSIPNVATIASAFGAPADAALFKMGSGVLVLSGTANFSGMTVLAVSGGVVRVTSSSAIAGLAMTSTSGDGQIELQNASTTGTTMMGAGSSLPNPLGTIYSSAGNNTWTGNWFTVGAGNGAGVASGLTLNHVGLISDGIDPALNGFSKFGAGTLVTTQLALNGHMHINAGTLVLRAVPTLSTVQSLDMAGGTSPTVQLDVTNNKLVVRSDTSATIKQQIHAGANGGQWNGYGITSSIAAADAAANGTTTYAVGYVRGDQLPSFNGSTASFGAATLNGSDVAIMLTRVGDTNLDGVIDAGSDFSNFVAGYTAPHTFLSNTDWFNGDFNHDGVIDLQGDFNLFAHGFASLGGSLPTLTNAVSASGLPPAAQQTMETIIENVPEPTSLLGLVGWALLAARRRR